MPSDRQLLIIDETLREGMQYHGVMFSLEQRINILAFQEKLGVDVCQAGYPGAHPLEAGIVRDLCGHAGSNRYRIRMAAMGRATPGDAGHLARTGIDDMHFHTHINSAGSEQEHRRALDHLVKTAGTAKRLLPGCRVSIALLDIGRAGDKMLATCVNKLDHPDIDILSLPDTSGMLAPNTVFEKISPLAGKLCNAKIAVHCHNDMGMANANALMGILAGGRVLEASALGIGERNGLSDLFVTASHLKDQGFDMRLNIDDTKTFEAYYAYVDQIVRDQTGHGILTVNTPVFGDAVKTHVAGTHADGQYGLAAEENIYLNILCGQHLVKKYLAIHAIKYPETIITQLTREIKQLSVRQNKAPGPSQVRELVDRLAAGK